MLLQHITRLVAFRWICVLCQWTIIVGNVTLSHGWQWSVIIDGTFLTGAEEVESWSPSRRQAVLKLDETLLRYLNVLWKGCTGFFEGWHCATTACPLFHGNDFQKFGLIIESIEVLCPVCHGASRTVLLHFSRYSFEVSYLVSDWVACCRRPRSGGEVGGGDGSCCCWEGHLLRQGVWLSQLICQRWGGGGDDAWQAHVMAWAWSVQVGRIQSSLHLVSFL